MPSRLYLSPPHMGGLERQFIDEAFASNYIAPVGPQVDAFEREFAETVGVRNAVALTSGTAAIHLALLMLGVGAGDAVFASTLTFIGGVSPICYVGASPIFIDADERTWNMDPELLAEELAHSARENRLPKAVIATDLYGQCADLDALLAACRPHGVPVVIDAAESLGSAYKGGWSRPGAQAVAFSFNGNKIVTTSGGGMLATEDKSRADYVRFLSQQARDPAPHYEHSQIGFNFRMSNILAAIGRGQLRVLEERVESKRRIFSMYAERLANASGISLMPEAAYNRSNRWLTVLQIDPKEFGADREAVRNCLETENIESRPVWKPMHMQPVFSEAKYVRGRVAERLFRNGLCLPSGTAMTESDIDRVTYAILRTRG